jgi:hypothetical protein
MATTSRQSTTARFPERTVVALGVACIVAATSAALGVGAILGPAASWAPPPVNAKVDYQIGGDYPLPRAVKVVSRDWFLGSAPKGVYAVCYVNAYQTQDDEAGVERADERSNWPRDLVLTELGQDPNWGGEFLVDISTKTKRARAAGWIEQMVRRCAAKGFDAVEFDNLDSWTRFDRTPLGRRVPFERVDAIAYAELLVDLAHGYGLAAAQKNTGELPRRVSRGRIGFDFAIAEECGRWNECQDYRDVYGDRVIAIEYRLDDFLKTCKEFGSRLSVVLRDMNVTAPRSKTYRYRAC